MGFAKAADVSEIPVGRMKRVRVGGTEVLLANMEGKFYATAAKCSHAGGDLSLGRLDGTVVTCPRHGSRFDLTTGKALEGPRIAFIRLNVKDIASFETRVDGAAVMVSIP